MWPAADRALTMAKPEIINSGQGSQYISPEYVDLLTAAGVRVSMNGRGRAHDNIFTARLWGSVKYEEVYLHETSRRRKASVGSNCGVDVFAAGSGN